MTLYHILMKIYGKKTRVACFPLGHSLLLFFIIDFFKSKSVIINMTFAVYGDLQALLTTKQFLQS